MSKCGEIPALVHPARTVLAARLAGPARLPDRVDPFDSIPAGGDCRRRGARVVTRHRDASAETRPRTSSPVTSVQPGGGTFLKARGAPPPLAGPQALVRPDKQVFQTLLYVLS